MVKKRIDPMSHGLLLFIVNPRNSLFLNLPKTCGIDLIYVIRIFYSQTLPQNQAETSAYNYHHRSIDGWDFGRCHDVNCCHRGDERF